jgi:hypothetical protein
LPEIARLPTFTAQFESGSEHSHDIRGIFLDKGGDQTGRNQYQFVPRILLQAASGAVNAPSGHRFFVCHRVFVTLKTFAFQ